MRVRHVACPKCREMGKDKTGDNLAIFPDGGKFCFSCGYGKRGDVYIPPVEEAKRYNKVSDKPLPQFLINQLYEYLSYEEIAQHFKFDDSRYRAVLADTLPQWYWGRNKASQPKVYTQGKVPFHVFSRDGHDYESVKTLVVVEDPISAIAVSRVYPCLALFGSHFPTDWYQKLTLTGYDTIIVWLDKDKSEEGLKLALQLRHLFKTKWCSTTYDPKAYNREETEQILYRVITKGETAEC